MPLRTSLLHRHPVDLQALHGSVHCRSARRRPILKAQAQGRSEHNVAASTSGAATNQQQEAQLRFNGTDATPSDEQQTSARQADGAPAVVLHYHSGWHQPTILYSLQGAEWKRQQLSEVASSGGAWKAATFPLNGANGNSAGPVLEFVISNPNGSEWDKTAEGNNYVLSEHGRYSLKDGQIAAVPGDPVLVVSDLDDTMIGDDSATAVFKRFWERDAVPRGSRLVYNTGRSLEKCLSLFEEKRDVLPPPDLLICSIGTKVYILEDGEWAVDTEHAAKLDEQWELEVVREAAYAALAAVGRSEMHFRPPEEQNEHKVTCGVSTKALEQVLERIERALAAEGVRAHLITSGTGDWRFLDIVAQNAGKLEAMEHVRHRLGFPAAATVACGDSGNDIAMFEHEAARGIVVGNAQSELLDWLQKKGQDGDERVVLTEATRARGILEGLGAFGFL